MKALILIWSLLLPYMAFGQATSSDTQYRNDGETLINGSFEQGKKGYTLSVGSGSLVWSTQSTTSLNGKAMQLTLSAQTFSFKSATTQGSKLTGQNGYIEVYLSANNSGAEICPLVDGVSAPTTTPNECQPIIAGVGFKPYGIQKVFGATSLNYEIRGVSNASYTGVIYADDGSVAKTTKVQSEIISYSNYNAGTITISSTGTAPTKGTVVTDKILVSRKGKKINAYYQYQQTTAGTNGTGDYLFSLPSGLSFDTSSTGITPYSGNLFSSNSAHVLANVGVGTTTYNGIYQNTCRLVAYNSTQFRVLCQNTPANGGAVNTYIIQGADFTLGLTGTSYGFNLEAPIAEWSDSNIKFLNQPSGGWFIDANIGGSAVSSAISSSYVELTNASLDLVLNTSKGSADAQIACASGTDSTGFTCSSSESVGITFVNPKTGKFRACFTYAVNMNNGNFTTQLVETTTTSSSIIQEGSARYNAYSGNSTTLARYPIENCSTFNFNDVKRRTIRLMYESDVANPQLLIDRDASTGQRDLHIFIEPVVENIQASLQGYNSTDGAINPEIFSVSYGTTNLSTVCSASPCSYLDQIGNYAVSVTRSNVADYTLNLNKTFSKLKCSFNGQDSGSFTAGFGNATYASCTNCNSLHFITIRSSTGSAVDSLGTLFCHGVK